MTSQPHCFGLFTPGGHGLVDGGAFVLPRVTTIGTTIPGITPAATAPKITPLLTWCACDMPVASAPPPLSVSFVAATRSLRAAWTGGVGAELSPLLTMLIWPALTITHTPARLQTLTKPSNTITLIV